jgi:hypothetical protein
MAGRSRPSFNKRLKERARQEKQREKAERKQQRKLQKGTGDPEAPETPETPVEGNFTEDRDAAPPSTPEPSPFA